MATVKYMNVVLGMNTGKFQKGTQSAVSSLGSLKSAIGVTSGAIGALAGVIGGAAAFLTIKALTQDSMEAIDSTAKLADRLGTSTEALLGLQHAADLSGTSADSLQSALEKMSVNLSKAKGGAAGAKDAFEQLGLNVDDLASGDPIEAVKQIADGINALPSASDRAAASMEIFGKQGIGLLSTLAEGSEGIAEMTAETVKLGLSYSRVDAAQVEAANDAISRAGKLVTGLGNQLAIQLSPYIEVAANKLTEFATTGVDMASVVSTSLDWISSGVGFVADALDLLKIGAMTWWSSQVSVAALLFDSLVRVAEGLEYLVNLLPGVNVSFTGTLRGMADRMNSFASEQRTNAWDSFLAEPPSTGIKSFFDDIKTSAASAALAITNAGSKTKEMGDDMLESATKVAELESKLKEQIATFGMSSREIELFKLSQAGASSEVLSNVTALTAQLDAMEATKKINDDLASSAQQVIEANMTAGDKYQAEIEKLQTLLDKGLIDQGTYDRATEKAGKDLGTPAASEQPKFGAALELGSSEARSAILRNRFGSESSKDPNKDVAKNTKDLVAKEIETISVLKQIAASLADSETIDV
jgi:plasmid maintenance system antidote protein VapI